ncbi:hypothetical protein [Paenilisteria weihenstephanensis]|uniref:hypothetical protein n=1 Tax=Listeria weihenstephanensis TaxID=1006155 RepID=UPI000563ADE0|nr:hypothetical protein [Listeria weihenstephanensis]
MTATTGVFIFTAASVNWRLVKEVTVLAKAACVPSSPVILIVVAFAADDASRAVNEIYALEIFASLGKTTSANRK